MPNLTKLIITGLILLQAAGFIPYASADTVEFYDTFTDTNYQELYLHGPDTGLGWTEIISIGSGAKLWTENNTLKSSGIGDRGSLYRTNDTISGADYEVTVLQVDGDNGDDLNWLAARIQDTENLNMYVLCFNESYGSVELHKCVEGIWSLLDTTWALWVVDDSIVKLKVEGTTISAYDDDTVMFSITDDSHTLAGHAGVGMGDIGVTAGDDMSYQALDNFTVTVTEAAAAARRVIIID